MRSLASRCLAVAAPLLLSFAACSTPSDAPADTRGMPLPTEPTASRGKPASGSALLPPMSITPGTLTMSVGSTVKVAVTYRDAKGAVVPESNFRWTYYGCVPVAPVATCNDLLTLLPLSPYLRQAEIHAMSAGQARIYATDGLGTYVWADLSIQ
jgi:hypothetical protein